MLASEVVDVSEYIGIAACFLLAGGITGAMVLLGSTLGKKKPTPEKLAQIRPERKE